jgi:glucose/arabinose dehydrogenase
MAGPIATGIAIVDDRVPQDAALVAAARSRPTYALGGHTASLGLCWMPEGTLPGFPTAW